MHWRTAAVNNGIFGRAQRMPVTQKKDTTLTLDDGDPSKPQLLRRLHQWYSGENRFELVGNKPWDGNFLCANDIVNHVENETLNTLHNKAGWSRCQVFNIETAEELNGIQLFRLRSENGEFLELVESNDPRGYKFLSKGTADSASRFYFIDEPTEFFALELYKSPFNAISKAMVNESLELNRLPFSSLFKTKLNEIQHHVLPYEAGSTFLWTSNIDKPPMKVPIWMRIPLNYNYSSSNLLDFSHLFFRNHLNMDHLEFSTYGKVEAHIEPDTKEKQAALFHLDYNTKDKTFALRLINYAYDHKSRWLCFARTLNTVKRLDGM